LCSRPRFSCSIRRAPGSGGLGTPTSERRGPLLLLVRAPTANACPGGPPWGRKLLPGYAPLVNCSPSLCHRFLICKVDAPHRGLIWIPWGTLRSTKRTRSLLPGGQSHYQGRAFPGTSPPGSPGAVLFPFFILHESSWSQADFIYTVMLAGAFASCLSQGGQGSFSHRRARLSWGVLLPPLWQRGWSRSLWAVVQEQCGLVLCWAGRVRKSGFCP